MARSFRIILACAGLLLTAAAGVYWFSGWSRINCWTHEINVETGHQRYTRYWFWITTAQRVEATWISDALGFTENTAITPETAWRDVLTLSPGTGNSPHYAFHSALYDLRKGELLLTYTGAKETDLKNIAHAVTWLWRAFDNDAEAGAFLSHVAKASMRRGKFESADVPSIDEWLHRRREQISYQDRHSPYAAKLDAAIASLEYPASP